MPHHQVLITTSYLEPGGDVDTLLARAGCDVKFSRPQDRQGDDEALVRAVSTAEAVIAGNDKFTPDVLRAAPNLKLIARTGVGYDGVHLDTADELGIRVCNTPGVNQQSVAELTLSLILNCARHTIPAAVAVQDGAWKQISGIEVAGKTLGIIGLGSIGRAVAHLAHAIGMTVLAFDIARDDNYIASHPVEICTLPNLLQRADFVSVHVGLTESTRHLLNMDTLALMKPSAYLINTSRGGVVSEHDLSVALAEHKLAGAALDVLEIEPPGPGHPLHHVPGVVITPHIAGATKQARARSSTMAARQILDFFAERPVTNLVNRSLVS